MRLLLSSLLAFVALAAPAAAEIRTVAQVQTPTRGENMTAFPVIDAFGGRVVWSDYDAATDAWRLMEHSGGVTRGRCPSVPTASTGCSRTRATAPRSWLPIEPPR